MLKIFNQTKNLQEIIIEDKNNLSIPKRRYPVRFIFFKNRNDYKIIKRFLSKQKCVIKGLDEKLLFEDAWITTSSLYESFKEIKSDILLYGLSEVLRFYNNDHFRVVLEDICQIETNTNMRIYVPMFGLLERFLIFWQNYYRCNEWADIWVLDTGKYETVNIHFTNDEVVNENYNVIYNTKEWINLINKDQSTVLLKSNTLLSLIDKFSYSDNHVHINAPNLATKIKGNACEKY